MKALVPLNTMDHVKDYIEVGAEEFYIGFYDPAWSKQFGAYADINRMSGYGKEANQYSFEELVELIPKIRELGTDVFVTFNSSMYSSKQLEFMSHYMTNLKRCLVDGVIVSCAELVPIARLAGVPVVVSTIAGVYNSDIAKYYADLGASRIILPRDLGVEEIEQIVACVPDVEYEVFMMRNGCHFSDSNCLGFHRKDYSSLCSSVCNANVHMIMNHTDFHATHRAELNNMLYNHSFHRYACGLCAIYRFVKMGITAGKIVGRSDEWESICEDIQLVKENVTIALASSTEEEYLQNMKFPSNSIEMCKLGFSCYYPQIRYTD